MRAIQLCVTQVNNVTVIDKLRVSLLYFRYTLYSHLQSDGKTKSDVEYV